MATVRLKSKRDFTRGSAVTRVSGFGSTMAFSVVEAAW